MKESFKREQQATEEGLHVKVIKLFFGSVLQGTEKENYFRCLKFKIVKTNLQEKKTNAANAKVIY